MLKSIENDEMHIDKAQGNKTEQSNHNEGMWFTDAHSPTALCAPSRYAFMTGNYNYRSYAPWGVWGAFQMNAIYFLYRLLREF